MQSRGTDLITTQDQTVGLVYVLVFKINHRQEIVRYQLCYFFLILVVVFYFEIWFHGRSEWLDWTIIGKTIYWSSVYWNHGLDPFVINFNIHWKSIIIPFTTNSIPTIDRLFNTYLSWWCEYCLYIIIGFLRNHQPTATNIPHTTYLLGAYLAGLIN